MITCSTHTEALMLAFDIFPYSVGLDDNRSSVAGYPIYYAEPRRNGDVVDAYISDLKTRIELNYPDGTTKLIHIDSRNAPDFEIQTTVGAVATVRPFEYDGTGFETINCSSYLGAVNIVFDTDANDKYVMKVFDSNGLLLYSRIVDKVVYLQINQVKLQCKS